jgi:hypothetical protein
MTVATGDRSSCLSSVYTMFGLIVSSRNYRAVGDVNGSAIFGVVDAEVLVRCTSCTYARSTALQSSGLRSQVIPRSNSGL